MVNSPYRHIKLSQYSHFHHSATILGAHATAMISIVFKNRQAEVDANGFYSALCYFQAVCFQFFRTAFIWNWILSMVVIYFVVVRKTPVNKLREKSRWFYWAFGSISALMTIVPMIANKLGKVPRAELCWITGSVEWLIAAAYIHMLLGIILFAVVAVPTFRELHRSAKHGSGSRASNTLKDLMYRHTIEAVFLFVTITFSFLASMNGILLDYWDGAFDSSYIASTMYTYCVIRDYMLPAAGLVIALIHSISYSFIQRCFSSVKSRFRRSSSRFTTASMDLVLEGEYRISETPKSLGITVVSIPPDPRKQRALLNAHSAYTANLLMHAKEELAEIGMEESEIDSFISEQSSYLTDAETNEEFSERLLAAQKRWIERYNNP